MTSKRKPGEDPVRVAGFSALGVAASFLLCISGANAAGLNFILDQSNRLPDGEDYLDVEIADGTAGAIDFRVTPTQLLGDSSVHHFGMQLFAFNVVEGTRADAGNITGLPEGWKAFNNKLADGFGRYDIVLIGSGWNRQEELNFSLTGVEGDSPGDYAEESRGRAPQGNEFFAARAAGFKVKRPRPDYGHGGDDWDDDSWEDEAFGELLGSLIEKWGNMHALDWMTAEDSWEAGTIGNVARFLDMKRELLHFASHNKHKRIVRSAFFGGSAVVPIPAAGWLLASALTGLAALRRRRPAPPKNAQ